MAAVHPRRAVAGVSVKTTTSADSSQVAVKVVTFGIPEESRESLELYKYLPKPPSVKDFTRRLLTQLAFLTAALIALSTRNNFVDLLRVPHIGFALYKLAGGPFPPYFDDSIWSRQDEWLRPGDVVIAAPPKSGTTWMMFTVYALREAATSRGIASPLKPEMAPEARPQLSQRRPRAKTKSFRNGKLLGSFPRRSELNRGMCFVRPKHVSEDRSGTSRKPSWPGNSLHSPTFLRRSPINDTSGGSSSDGRPKATGAPETNGHSIDETFSEWIKDVKPKRAVDLELGARGVLSDDETSAGELFAGFRDIYEEVIWPELVYYPGQPLEERIRILREAHQDKRFRIFKTHASPPTLQPRPDVRYIVSARNPLDAIESARDFMAHHNPTFSRLWGGFPILTPTKIPRWIWRHVATTPLFLRLFVADFVRAWYSLCEDDNVLFVHYADRIRDDGTELKRLASFLDLTDSLTDRDLSRIKYVVGFQEMKRRHVHFNLRHIFEPFKRSRLMPQDVQILLEDEPALLTKGPDRNEEPSEEENQRMLLALRDVMRDDTDAFRWLYEGAAVSRDAEEVSLDDSK